MKIGSKSIATFSAGLLCGLLLHWLPAHSASAFEERNDSRGGLTTETQRHRGIKEGLAAGDAGGISGGRGGDGGVAGSNCPADIAPPGGDGQVSVLDLLEVINEWGLCPADPDNDNDGWTVGEGDCDDDNRDIYPGAPEVCNGIDDDCDTQIDEGAASIGPEPNNACVQATYLGQISGDNCGGPLNFSANLVPAGDIDYMRLAVTEDNDGIVDLYARITLTVPPTAPAPVRLTAWCESCGGTFANVDVQPGQTQSLTMYDDDDWTSEDGFDAFLEVRQLGGAPGMCQPYQLMVTCTPGAVNLTCD